MKSFNETHEAIITSGWVEVEVPKGTKEGDLIPHQKRVDRIKMYEPTFDRDGLPAGFQEICLTRQFIIDMYEEITKLESEVKNMPYDTLPF